MDAVLRSSALYLILLLLLRLSGKRTLAQITVFDLILILIVSEATQQALLGPDFSLTQATLVILTIVGLDRSLDALSSRFPRFSRLVNDRPIVLIEDGRLLEDRMRRMNVSAEDILEHGRQAQAVERLDQIKYAVLERSGGISVIPRAG